MVDHTEDVYCLSPLHVSSDALFRAAHLLHNVRCSTCRQSCICQQHTVPHTASCCISALASYNSHLGKQLQGSSYLCASSLCLCALQITHRETIAQINELTGAAITIRGRFYDKGERIPDDDKKLHLIIEGPTQAKVRAAKDECKAIIADFTERSIRRDQGAQGPGKYNVM